ncbi:hypothetical protein KCV03_g116, partial [Aureobasidium melanogenum]
LSYAHYSLNLLSSMQLCMMRRGRYEGTLRLRLLSGNLLSDNFLSGNLPDAFMVHNDVARPSRSQLFDPIAYCSHNS